MNAKIYHTGPLDAVEREYRTIVSRATGQVWLDRNIGADSRTSASTSKTDTWNGSYGLVFRWYDVMIQADGSTDGDFRMGGPNPICPKGFGLPTTDEWCEEAANGTGGTVGCPDDNIGAISNGATAFYHLLLPMAGRKTSLGEGSAAAGVHYLGTYGQYWSSNFSDDNGQNLYFRSGDAYLTTDPKSLGFPIRCLKD